MRSLDHDHLTLLLRDRLRLRGGGETPSRRLAWAVRDLAEAGALPPGTRLPSERELAPAVGMSRGTVAAGYRALVEAGLCERRHGSGTYLLAPAISDIGHLMRRDALLIDMSKSTVPDPSFLRLPGLDPADLLRAPSQHGYDLLGDARLRAALRGRVSGDFLVTSGGQHGIDLALRCFVRPRDAVLVEETTYPGALAVIRRCGAEPVPVACDVDGPDPDAFRAAVARHRPVAAYLIAVHSPTGRVTAPERVAEVARVAREHDVLLVEDRALAELVHGVPAPRSYAGEHPDGTVTVGSLSKVLWGGLRIGWVAAAPPLLARIAELKMENDLATSTVSQRMAAAALEHSAQDEWLAELARRRDHLSAVLRRDLPQWTWRQPDGGLSLWVRLPGADAERYADLARAHGVAVAPGPLFSPDRGYRDHLRISFALTTELLDRAVAGLASAWHARATSPVEPGSGLDLPV
ncbi:PLP-dependent aminotransferase family protein [Micromonospora sp. CPCC 205371]|nr:PLP-dependent aminotransferase family protein [Micromonospora sp. CPCC 205371]